MRIVTVFGGSGFVGRYIIRRFAKAGWHIRVAVRRPNEALFLKTYGKVGQIEPILTNIRDDQSVQSALYNASLVINCVGILSEYGSQNFEAVQHEGAGRIAKHAAKLGLERMIHLSAIGADAHSESEYARSKAAGEAVVLEHLPNSVILRPSIIFGHEDQFFNRFASLARMSPFIPLFGAKTQFQPVYVDDVAQAAEQAAADMNMTGIYELGGPEVASFQDLMEKMLAVIDRKRIILPLPNLIGNAMAMGFSTAEFLSLGLFRNGVITRDQIKQLQHDNIVAKNAKGFSEIGIQPTSLDVILPEYLYQYRREGQYTEMTEAAKLRKS